MKYKNAAHQNNLTCKNIGLSKGIQVLTPAGLSSHLFQERIEKEWDQSSIEDFNPHIRDNQKLPKSSGLGE